MDLIAPLSLFETSGLLQIVGVIFLFNLALTGAEILLDLVTKKRRNWADSIANCGILLATQLLERTAFGSLGVLALLPFHYMTPIEIPINGWTWAAALIAADFTYYWMHRFEHERRILWASHSVHHSSQDYNLTVGFRLCLIESLFEWIFLVPMILAGFHPFQAVLALVFVAQYQHWIHTERVGRLGWLDGIFNTPSTHRVHHGSNADYLDKNYGGVLIIWDRLFGTYQAEVEPVIYGLTENINTVNPITINTSEFSRLWVDMKRCRTFGDKLRLCFGRLTWRPKYFGRPSD